MILIQSDVKAAHRRFVIPVVILVVKIGPVSTIPRSVLFFRQVQDILIGNSKSNYFCQFLPLVRGREEAQPKQ